MDSSKVYGRLVRNWSQASKRNLPLAKKILLAHSTIKPPLQNDHYYYYSKNKNNNQGKAVDAYLKLYPDRVAMQDASAQMALLQFMLAGKPTSAIPTSVHCDHLIQAHQGASEDLQESLVTNKEIFAFLKESCLKYGLEFWKPGSGIIHQLVLGNVTTHTHILRAKSEDLLDDSLRLFHHESPWGLLGLILESFAFR
jgi:aconitase A